MLWYVYVLYSVTTGRLYTGVALSPKRRLGEHNGVNGNKRGAKATRRGRPWKLVWIEKHESKSDALKREYAIKQMRRKDKLVLVGLAA